MKYPIFFFCLLMWGCQSSSSGEPTSSETAAAEQAEPVPQQQEPVTYSTQSPSLLYDLLRNTMRTELGFTLPETNGDTRAKKSFAFKITDNNNRIMWAVKVKWHDAETDKLYAGAEYMLLWNVVDINAIEIINSPDGQRTALRIKPTTGNTFVYHPYSNDPDIAVNEAIIGWFDRSQDAALKRVYTYMHQLAQNMDKWEK